MTSVIGRSLVASPPAKRASAGNLLKALVADIFNQSQKGPDLWQTYRKELFFRQQKRICRSQTK
jgi:hypothetical protein